MEMVDYLVKKITGWIDSLFYYFGSYSNSYSKFFVYGLLIYLLSKLLKVKVDVKTEGGKK